MDGIICGMKVVEKEISLEELTIEDPSVCSKIVEIVNGLIK